MLTISANHSTPQEAIPLLQRTHEPTAKSRSAVAVRIFLQNLQTSNGKSGPLAACSIADVAVSTDIAKTVRHEQARKKPKEEKKLSAWTVFWPDSWKFGLSSQDELLCQPAHVWLVLQSLQYPSCKWKAPVA